MTSSKGRQMSRRWVGWLWAAWLLFAIALACSWYTARELDALFDQLDESSITQSRRVLEHLLKEEQRHRSSAVNVLADDARVRALVLTPDFDEPTAVDILADIKSTAGATLVAMLGADGTVRSVIGADELRQVNLGTSTLIRKAREGAVSTVWVFGGEAGVLAAAPVKLGEQLRGLFMMGFKIEGGLLAGIEQALGTSSAIFVGGKQVASSGSDPRLAGALAAAAALPMEQFEVLAGKYLASASRLTEFGRVAWVAPMHRRSNRWNLSRSLTALPAVFTGLMLAMLMGLATSRPRVNRNLDPGSWTRKENES